MAVSKRQKRAGEIHIPDAALFVRVIEDGHADPAVVSAAYQQALRQSITGTTEAERLALADVVQERPEIDPAELPTPEAQMVMLHRQHTFKGGTDDQHPASWPAKEKK